MPNIEQCWLATRGQPKRQQADVRQVIDDRRREHSRKPDGIHDRIERLVAGPYLELWARQSDRPGWSFWGAEITKFNGHRSPPPEQLSWDDMWAKPFERPDLIGEVVMMVWPHWYLSRTAPVTLDAKRGWPSICYVVLPYGRRHYKTLEGT